MPLKWITKFVAGLNANTRPGEIAAALAFGFLLALQPGMTIPRIAFLAFAFMLKINMAALFLSLFLFALVSPAFDVPVDLLGGYILTLPPLQNFFTTLYNMPLVPYTRFNDTLVMGGLAGGLILWLPLFFAVRAFIGLYRKKLREKIANNPAVKAFLKLPVVSNIAKLIGKVLSLSGGL
jgi:uncharacterized protein (TIGR03546 family)